MPIDPAQIETWAASRHVAWIRTAGRRCSVLPLWPIHGRELVKGEALDTLGWLVRTASTDHPATLEALDLDAWDHLAEGAPLRAAAPPLDQRISRASAGPGAVLEALAVCALYDLPATVWRARGQDPEPRRLEGIRLGLRRGVIVAADLDRDGPRSFRLQDLVAVQVAEGTPLPVWDRGAWRWPDSVEPPPAAVDGRSV